MGASGGPNLTGSHPSGRPPREVEQHLERFDARHTSIQLNPGQGPSDHPLKRSDQRALSNIAVDVWLHRSTPPLNSVIRRSVSSLGEWKLVHRHADPITTPQAPESVLGSAI